MGEGEQILVGVYQELLTQLPGINEEELGGIRVGKIILLNFTYSAPFRSKYPKTVYLRFQTHPESETCFPIYLRDVWISPWIGRHPGMMHTQARLAKH